jgi:very-short-patch-repair endonuclease
MFYPISQGIDGRKKFCSKKCADKSRTIKNIAYTMGVKLSPKIYYRTVHKSAKDYMKKNNPMKREEVKTKVKKYWESHPEKQKAHLAKMRQACSKLRPTKLEIKLFTYLEQLEADFEPYAIIKKNFTVDAKIGKLIIQADGDYWHGHPRFEPLIERQIKQRRRDVAQDKYLTTCGYIVERIWESEMSFEKVRNILSHYNLI